jgi:hypothetical protein
MVPGGIALVEQTVAALTEPGHVCLSSDELIAFARLRTQIDSAFAHQVGQFNRQGLWALDGRKSMSGWLASRCGMSHSESSRMLRRAEFATSCPLTAAAWATGAVSSEKIDRIITTRNQAKANEAFAEFEPTLLALAISGTAADVTNVAQQWLQALDDSREADDTLDDAQLERQHLHLSETFHGMGVLSGEFVPIDREEIEVALEREMGRLRSEGDERPLSRQRADALVSILRLYNSQSITQGTNQPHISIHIDHSTWLGESVGLCETSRGLRLSRETVMRMACNALISVITHDGNAVPLDMHRTQRTFNRAQRRALEFRDGGCRYPGCTRNAGQTEAHHEQWWELGGETNLDNGVLLCYFHHRLIHEGRWTIKIDGGAVVKWFKPDGSHHDTSYPRKLPPQIPIPHRRPD